MQKASVGLIVLVLVIGLMSMGAAAQTINVALEEWFADSIVEVDGQEAKAGMNLTTIKGEYGVSDKITLELLYTFGRSKALRFSDDAEPPTDQMPTTLFLAPPEQTTVRVDPDSLRIGGYYALTPSFKVGGGYLTTDLSLEGSDASGFYLGAKAETPLAERLTLRGEVLYSPFINGDYGDAKLTSADLGLVYAFDSWEVGGGYRWTEFALEGDDSFGFSGLYLGAGFRF